VTAAAPPLQIRPGVAADLEAVAAIQSASPEAAQWNAAAYLHYQFLVAIQNERVIGFVVGRTVGEGEHELLNLAVAAGSRRQGVAKRLLGAWLTALSGEVFLEVRASNRAARKLYHSVGFQSVGFRPNYYENPVEAAIVMKIHSC
jgi:ribosomal-protein-alanine N-acetyltransferase